MISVQKSNEIYSREAKVRVLKERLKSLQDLTNTGNVPFPKGWKLVKAQIELRIKINENCRAIVLSPELAENLTNVGADVRCYQKVICELEDIINSVEKTQPKIDRLNLAIGEHRAKIKLLKGDKQ